MEPDKLLLKKGARYFLTANLNPKIGLYNGCEFILRDECINEKDISENQDLRHYLLVEPINNPRFPKGTIIPILRIERNIQDLPYGDMD